MMKVKRSVINTKLKILISTMKPHNKRRPLFVLTKINTKSSLHKDNLRPRFIAGHKQSLVGFIYMIRMRNS
jgi:hypothetical protein